MFFWANSANAQVEISFADAGVTELEDIGIVTVDVEISDPGDCTVG